MKIEDIIQVINSTMPNYHITSTPDHKKRIYVKGRVDRFAMFSIYTYGDGLSDSDIWFVIINRMLNIEKYEIEIPEKNIKEFFLLLDSYLMRNKEISSMIDDNNKSFDSLIKKNDLYKSNIREIKINKIL